MNPAFGVEILLPSGAQEVSILYCDGGGALYSINGSPPVSPLDAGFGHLDGTSLAGVIIETELFRDFPTSEDGILTLQGPINSLVLAGVELSFFEITVLIPEPTSAAMLLVALLCVAGITRLIFMGGPASPGELA